MPRALTVKPYPFDALFPATDDEPGIAFMAGGDDPADSSGSGNDSDWGIYWPGVTLHANDSGDWLEGGGGNDTLIGGAGVDRLFGRAGHDTMSGGGSGDYLSGESGNDTLAGNAGDDTLFGGTGNDRLTGGAGNDWLGGGEGADLFRFEMTEEIGQAGYIIDFRATHDSLSIVKGHTPVKGSAANYMEVQIAAGTTTDTMETLAEIYMQNSTIKHVFMTDGSDGFLFSGYAGDVEMWVKLAGLDSKTDFSWNDIV